MIPIINEKIHMGNVARAFNKVNFFIEQQNLNLPKNLYHFAPSFDAMHSILTSKQMWASHSYDMNDEKELWYGTNMLRLCLLEKQKMYSKRDIYQLKEFFEMAIERANPYSNKYNGMPEPFVISLCEDGTSESQWEKYGNKGKGYCVEFQTNPEFIRKIEKENLVLLKVIYDCKLQVQLINSAIQTEIDHILRHLDDPFARVMGMGASISLYNLLIFFTVIFKSAKWIDEHEWRLVRGMNQYREPVVPETRDREGKLVRFTRVEFMDFLPAISISKIIPGVNADEVESNSIIKLLDEI